MMLRFFPHLCLFFLLVSCAGQSVILPELTQIAQQPTRCPTLFPQGNYQFVHMIEFSMAGGNHGTAMGVTSITGNTIESVLMTVEGFVLFSAVLTDTLHITRAVSPFDKPGFAEGMMADIQTIFLQPRGRVQRGQLAEGAHVCRITQNDKQTVDIVDQAGHCPQVKAYSADKKLQTILTAHDCTVMLDSHLIPQKLILQSHKLGGYHLSLTLLSAEKK